MIARLPSAMARLAASRFYSSLSEHAPLLRLRPSRDGDQLSRGLVISADEKLWGSNNHCNESVVMNRRAASSVAALELEKKKRPRVQPGEVSPRLAVPYHIPKPPYVHLTELPEPSNEPQIQDAHGIVGMRTVGRLAAQTLNFAGSLVKPGVTTDEIDQAVHKMIIDAGAYPSLLGYGGFPKSISTGINEIMCCGIPDSRPLEDGDIISIHISLYLNGFHADTSRTFFCGTVDDTVARMCHATFDFLERAMCNCGRGVEFKRIGNLINDCADKSGFGVVRDFFGHGIGKILKSAPSIPHYRNDNPGRMVVGQTFTIEPILSLGSISGVSWPDKTTVSTLDGSPCALFGHTLLVTPKRAEILTY